MNLIKENIGKVYLFNAIALKECVAEIANQKPNGNKKTENGKVNEFSVTISVVESSYVESNQEHKQKPTPDLNGITVLVAEDERINFQLMQTILTKAGATVLHARNGFEAIEMVQNDIKNIDIILMDIKMPGLSGSDALVAIRQSNFRLPVIACTAYAQAEEASLFFDQGFDDYIPKPVKRHELIAIIEKNITKKA